MAHDESLDDNHPSSAITLHPVISDILRTRYCIPDSILLVEGIDVIPVSSSGRWLTIRLLLGDGELCVQAVLAPACHRFVHTGEIFVGCYVSLGKFEMEQVQAQDEREEDGDQQKKDMVFWVVKDITTVGWDEAYRDMARRGMKAELSQEYGNDDEDYFEGMDLDRLDPVLKKETKEEEAEGEAVKEEELKQEEALPPIKAEMETPTKTQPQLRIKKEDSFGEFGASDDFDDLDELLFPSRRGTPRATSRPNTPSRQNTPSRLSPSKTSTREPSPSKASPSKPSSLQQAVSASKTSPLAANTSPSKSKLSTVTTLGQLQHQPQPVALARDWGDAGTPLKLTTLYSIPHLPYAQNWSCNVLAIVSSLSDVEPSYLPPYKQRTARIADPSTAKQVHLTVFLDPEEFSPKVGSAVLLTGVKNHRFDGGSLKKYASDKAEGRWWFEDPAEMSWCDVKGIKDWWKLVEESMALQQEKE